jgi:uncharacterized protein (TIGR02186 family)
MNPAAIARTLLVALWLAGCASNPVRAESLVSTLSDDDVEITSDFTGEQIVVFGAVRGVPEGAKDYEVAVVVQGPDQDVIVRRKERFLGVWANRTSREFADVPSFYVMHLSPNFSAAADPARLGEYRLGIASLPFVHDAASETTAQSFAAAVVALKTRHDLYVERQNEVQFLAPGVFRTTFFLPTEIPTGEYRVSVYLFRDGAFLAGNTQALKIEKGGFSEQIARAADAQPLFYGLACVALAVLTGWLGGLIFRRP